MWQLIIKCISLATACGAVQWGEPPPYSTKQSCEREAVRLATIADPGRGAYSFKCERK